MLKRFRCLPKICVTCSSATPAGPQVTIGINPGFRTGCKVAVVDATGQFLTSETMYAAPPREEKEKAAATLRLIA